MLLPRLFQLWGGSETLQSKPKYMCTRLWGSNYSLKFPVELGPTHVFTVSIWGLIYYARNKYHNNTVKLVLVS